MNPKVNYIPSTVDWSNSQINNALLVLEGLRPYLMEATRHREFVPGRPEQPELDREVIDSAVTTFTKACDVLDVILNDKRRWDTHQLDTVGKELEKYFKEQTQFTEEQKKAAMQYQRASTILKPELQQSPEGWWAIYGDLKALGASPGEAMYNFDALYYGLVQSVPVAVPQKRKKK